MLLTASTIKDSLANVRFFVAANLASGVDHMVVFLDAPNEPEQQDVAEFLTAHPHVTCVRTGGKRWWSGDRPAGLNVRQRINANWTRAVLEPLDWAEWLFHVDGDEVALLDREAIAAVPDAAPAVRLQPLEAVSEPEPPRRPTSFKRLLDDADLNLLHVLGALGSPTNQAYFHGHVMGKSGVRPRSGLGLTLHDAVSAEGERQASHEDPRLRLLHYDAVSGAEFVRKWSALAGAGHTRYRASRAPLAHALKALVGKELPEATREKYLRRIYDLTTRDDVPLLAELGLLEEVDPEQGDHRPRALSPAEAADLAARVDELAQLPKRGFFVADATRDGRSSGSRRHGRVSRLRRIVRHG